MNPPQRRERGKSWRSFSAEQIRRSQKSESSSDCSERLFQLLEQVQGSVEAQGLKQERLEETEIGRT